MQRSCSNLSITSNGVCIEAAPESEDMQLIEFGNFLQELLAMWA